MRSVKSWHWVDFEAIFPGSILESVAMWVLKNRYHFLKREVGMAWIVSHTPSWLWQTLFHSLWAPCLVKQADLQKKGSSVQTLHNPFIFLKYFLSGLVWKAFVCVRAISQLHKSACHRERTGNVLSTLQILVWCNCNLWIDYQLLAYKRSSESWLTFNARLHLLSKEFMMYLTKAIPLFAIRNLLEFWNILTTYAPVELCISLSASTFKERCM